ncbi:MAG: patatin-like phospholipase family protein [Chloracidobacterium sp.]|uniref:Patatin-like phospholipase family protein n=1 Tax=Chloracidobacterium validum TaxID=2821543 RepID=A0ABX8BDB3_9BACT|nr:patatin-like phospholipase family protein [Chloracidobacterium validum]QUW03835.1 patatin-like phospholipase family protein [Chloracidobacterium validum]
MVERRLGLVFAGGGNRAFYQLGLMQSWADLWPRVRAVAACSAGACVVAMLLSGRATETAAFWKRRRAHVTRNINWFHPLVGRPLAPHAPIYRDTLDFCLADGGFERIRAQPFPLLVLTARLPPGVPPAAAVVLGLTAYNLEKQFKRGLVHPMWGRRLGFRPAVFDMRDCATAADLTALILASSATPPFTPLGRVDGQTLLDGGLVDNIPAFLLDDISDVQRQVVLMSRTYPAEITGRQRQRLYVAPLTPPPVSRWDYTRPDLVEATIAQGAREAVAHRPALDALLDEL